MSHMVTWGTVLTVLVFISGCRTYGGDGAEAATFAQIERVLERSQEHLSRAQAELRALETASSGTPVLESLAAQYAERVAAHEDVLERHREMVSRLSPNAEYRTLHRAYRALITDQSLLRDQYQRVLRHVYEAHSADTILTAGRDRPYALVPPYYARTAGGELTANAVISRVRSGEMPPADFRIVVPDTSSSAQHTASNGPGESGDGH